MVLFNTAPTMPRLIRQMLRLITMLPAASAFVSIYDMDSWDATGGRLPLAPEATAMRVHVGTLKEC